MREALKRMDEKVGPKSPLPYMIKLRNLIFGKKNPGPLVKYSFFVFLPIAIYFLLWNLLAFFAFSVGDLIRANKSIEISSLVAERFAELGIESANPIGTIQTYHSVSSLLMLGSIIGLVFLWRQKKMFFPLMFISMLFYLGMALFYVGGDYFWSEFSSVDKGLVAINILGAILVLKLQFYTGRNIKEESFTTVDSGSGSEGDLEPRGKVD